MLVIYLCFLLCFLHQQNAEETLEFDSESSEESIFDELSSKHEPFRLMGNMIDEARAIVLGIMRGDLSDEIRQEMKMKDVDLSGSYDGVSKVVKKCLRKAKNREEGKELVKKCFERAIKERQNEENQEEVVGGQQPTVQSCIQEAMYDASQSAAPLMMEAQEYGAKFREIVQKTANGLAFCRAEERPFQCMVGIWSEAQQNMTQMRDEVIDMMLVARDIYIQYMDDVRKCITPVEEVEEPEEESEVVVEEEGIKKGSTSAPPTKPTPPYYDPVEEVKRKAYYNKFFPS